MTASDITAPTVPSKATATGTYERNLNAFALPGFGATLASPFAASRDFHVKNRNRGSKITAATKDHVSVLWMLMGGWNHQYATNSAKITTIASATSIFLLKAFRLSMKERSRCGACGPRPPPLEPPAPPAPPALDAPPVDSARSLDAFSGSTLNGELGPCPPKGEPPPIFAPDCFNASNNASIPDVCFTGIPFFNSLGSILLNPSL